MYKATLDLCDHAKEIDMKCPVGPGKLNLKKTIDIPKQIPPVSIKLSILNAFQIIGSGILYYLSAFHQSLAKQFKKKFRENTLLGQTRTSMAGLLSLV